MPNPAWVPIVGSSFSDVGQQIAGWAGFNRGVEEGNIARRMAQDESINRYNANVWSMQRAAEEQARQQAIHDRDVKLQLAANRERDAQQRYQFGQQMDLDRERIAATQGAFEEKQRLKEEEQNKRIAAGAAKALQVQVLHANAGLDKAIADGKYDPTGAKADANAKVLAQLVSSAAAKSGVDPGIFFDKKTNRFTSTTPSLYGPEFWNNPPADYMGSKSGTGTTPSLYGPEFWNNPPADYMGSKSGTGTASYQFPSAVLNPAPAGIDWSPVQEAVSNAPVNAPAAARKPTRAEAADAVKRFGSAQAAATWLKDSGYDTSGYAD